MDSSIGGPSSHTLDMVTDPSAQPGQQQILSGEASEVITGSGSMHSREPAEAGAGAGTGVVEVEGNVVLDHVIADNGEGSSSMNIVEGEELRPEDAIAEQNTEPPGKRVKVYELAGQEWREKGTGQVEGMYDEQFDEAHLVVFWEADPEPEAATEGGAGTSEEGAVGASPSTSITTADPGSSSVSSNGTATTADGVEKKEGEAVLEEVGPGGFVREGEEEGERKELLRTRVLYSIPYQRQQDTLIVWAEPDGSDKALSFQDPLGCNNIWDFIQEVQQHMQLLVENDPGHAQSRSSPSMMSPPLSHDPQQVYQDRSTHLLPRLTISNILECLKIVEDLSSTPSGREKLAESLLAIDFLKQMTEVFQTVEDLAHDMESLGDLHALCRMLQKILQLNDNSIFDLFVQDEVFIGLCGILEYESDYPHYKASYRDFLTQNRFQEVIKFTDDNIRTKIHHTYRLQYLKDVVLARTLDDPTFNIINSLLFFNQIDIVNHVQGNEEFLSSMLDRFHPPTRTGKAGKAPELPVDSEEQLAAKRNIVKLLHSLVNMGKQIQLQNRSQLYRKLLDYGLLYVIGWTFRQEQTEQPEVRESLGKALEMLAQILEYDVNTVKQHVNMEKEYEKETGQKSLLQAMIALLVSHKDIGVKSQLSDSIRILLEVPEGIEAAARNQREGPIAETFAAYFFDSCAKDMYKPMSQIAEFTKVRGNQAPLNFPQQQLVLLQNLCELLSGFIAQHGHRSQFFILSQNISVQVAAVLYTRHKPLRHAALKYFKACIKTHNHFIHRHLAKNDLMLPLLGILEQEAPRDNMLTATCLEITEMLRHGATSTTKTIINYMFEKHQAKLRQLEDRPSIQHYIRGLRLRWEQINEPPPQDTPKPSAEEQFGWAKTAMEEDDYFNMSDEESSVIGPAPPSSVPIPAPKLKRKASSDPTMSGKRLAVDAGSSKEPIVKKILGLNYGDDSDSDSDRSPKQKPMQSLAPSPMDIDEPGPSTPKIKIRLPKEVPASGGEDMGDFASKLLQKRKRAAEEEEDEGGFGALMSGGRPGTPRGIAKKEKLDSSGSSAGTQTKTNFVREATKSIKLRVGQFGRKKETKEGKDGKDPSSKGEK